MAASANLKESVREALTDASSLIVICSPNGAKSHWVNEEVRVFSSLGRRHRIQCLLIPNDENSDKSVDREPEFSHPPCLNWARALRPTPVRAVTAKRNAFLKLSRV